MFCVFGIKMMKEAIAKMKNMRNNIILEIILFGYHHQHFKKFSPFQNMCAGSLATWETNVATTVLAVNRRLRAIILTRRREVVDRLSFHVAEEMRTISTHWNSARDFVWTISAQKVIF